MKRYGTLILLLVCNVIYVSAQSDFVPGANTIFEDRFELDPVGDFPAKWSTSGDGQVVTLDNADGKWLKISDPTAVSPELKKALPENCTIEFDLFLKNTSGVAPLVMFGLTSLSDVANGDVYRKHIAVKLHGYNESGMVEYEKNIERLGEKKFALEGYINRVLHVSMSVNKTRWRVYLDEQKVVDLPKLLTPEYRNNFFVASSTIIPSPEEGVYISNIRIAAGEADARSLLIRQLLEQGSVVTNDISFNPQTSQMNQESYAILDTLGQALVADPSLNIQINGMEQLPGMGENTASEKTVQAKVDQVKSYLVKKFNVKVDRIVTGVNNKLKNKADTIKNSKAGVKMKNFITEIVKL